MSATYQGQRDLLKQVADNTLLLTQQGITATITDVALNTTSLIGQKDINTSTATLLSVGASNLASRVYLLIQNIGFNPIYIGFSNSVSASNGFLLSPGSVQSFSFLSSTNINMYAISENGATRIALLEV